MKPIVTECKFYGHGFITTITISKKPDGIYIEHGHYGSRKAVMAFNGILLKFKVFQANEINYDSYVLLNNSNLNIPMPIGEIHRQLTKP